MSATAKATAAELGRELIRDARYRLMDESLPRILTCLDRLTEDDVWYRPNESTVSVGNLVLHLCGNVRQWIIATLGGQPDRRARQAEFDETGPVPTADLIHRLRSTLDEAVEVLDRTDPASLHDTHRVQGEVATGVSIIVHVVEHFSYHTGQITYAVKSRQNVDLGYYAGRDLDVTE